MKEIKSIKYAKFRKLMYSFRYKLSKRKGISKTSLTNDTVLVELLRFYSIKLCLKLITSHKIKYTNLSLEYEKIMQK